MMSSSCKHCQNLGLPSAHALRDNRTQKLLCPVLLNHQCPRCGKKGHTVSRCTKRLSVVERSVIPKKIEKTEPLVAKIENKFAALLDENDDPAVLPLPRKPEVVRIVEDKVLTPLIIPGNRGPTYADILARCVVSSPVSPPPPRFAAMKSKIINWADEDSDNE